MLVVKIKVGQAEGREIKLKSGAIKKVADQVGFIEVNEETRKVRLPIDIEGGQRPYEPGLYVLADTAFGVGRFHDLEINPYEVRLVPIAQALQKLTEMSPKVRAA